ncbi:uncharacterized protein CLUP02_16790 [Colletotrichum lupini]|uniref:Uncharacterized protein n=1 Tax=Colletotrichum lupini TaxID=145971 RepID=A0A9Q8TAT4_9PEZI|nr:uncharacterized protein CLUP02_16790 [Colletotrichum lupini]UQC91256.1 hypothetical protein CLUP02_16790 [Colletotrichum lupini]
MELAGAIEAEIAIHHPTLPSSALANLDFGACGQIPGRPQIRPRSYKASSRRNKRIDTLLAEESSPNIFAQLTFRYLVADQASLSFLRHGRKRHPPLLCHAPNESKLSRLCFNDFASLVCLGGWDAIMPSSRPLAPTNPTNTPATCSADARYFEVHVGDETG